MVRSKVVLDMSDSVYFGDIMRTLHEILKELKSMNKKLEKLNSTVEEVTT